ncbi:DUF3881 family protein [Frisingicoccus caecimuris]|uniref:Uncharacterized protein DUF3881 n=1 Tax=Frisingicoccus caecimuris TaxID=1796636 RepID=A0A4R2LD93_9FIRM|nr:DUF3881 family protein [Frisingicoccus caecimuris]MCR1918522.1 DUF3881 family protein [Frisingicoccus caecimuris]TCO85171.1 uncharacterized protein DUF3881 [Frisingicoccus caecimuris]
MHDYLRAIGFSNIKKNKDVRDILNLVMLRPTSEYVSSATDEEAVFGEKVKEFADRMGISVRGEYDENGQFHVGYYFPYFKAKNPTLKDEVTIEKQSDRDAYAGICDNVKVGVSLIFQLLNMADFIDYTEFHKGSLFYAPMYLTGLSVSGKVILPLMKTEEDVRRKRDESINRDRMIAAAREGDQDAIESLTLEDIDLYATISRRSKKEDVLTIVESYFMPYGIAYDQYSIMGDILSVETVKNSLTEESIYILSLECNNLIFDICINKEDLLGEPLPGRRFRGNVWMQGTVDFMGL